MENQDQSVGGWSRRQRLVFRFAFVYLLLYNLPFPLGTLPHTFRVAQKYESLWLKLVPWVGKHVLCLKHEVVTSTNCSGDTTYDYVRVLCYLGLAFAASLLWSFLDRSNSDYERLHEWLRVYVRLSLGTAILMYGADKIFLVHFPPPNLYKLLEPLGNYSRMSLLWTFMGASRSYTVFTGCLQILGGLLLFVPRLTTLGALVSLAVFSNIFALNLSYDLPVKLYSLHVLIFCFFLLLPDTRRLAQFFLLRRSVALSSEIGLLDRPRLNTIATIAQLVFGGVLACLLLYRAHDYEKRTFGAGLRPPFFGIWIVDEFMVSGRPLTPLSTDGSRWQTVVFQFPDKAGIRSINGSWVDYGLGEDMVKKTLTMENLRDGTPALELTFSSPEANSLILEGRERGSPIRIKLHRIDERQFALLGTGFHWIDEDAVLVMDEERVCDRVRRSEK